MEGEREEEDRLGIFARGPRERFWGYGCRDGAGRVRDMPTRVK